MYTYIIIALLALLSIWTIGSYVIVRNIEKPAYTVIAKQSGYEVREYAPYIVAETTVTGTFQEATSKGFRIIADYIFGNNVSNTSIAMTSPVLEKAPSEKIAMTSPVLDTEGAAGTRTISFVLPAKYTLKTLPQPNNSQVELREVPAQKVAVLSFTWYPTTDRVEQKKERLLSLLAQDNVTSIGDVQVARYNPPLSMPLILRNEIIIPIQ